MKRVTTQGKTKGKTSDRGAKAPLVERLRGLPVGTLVLASVIVDELEAEEEPQNERRDAPSAIEPSETVAQHWRTLLWTAPAECRIGREELLEAVGRPRSWIYRHTAAKADRRIPHRKLDGELVFVVGEVRAWLKEAEEIVEAGPLSAPRLQAVR